MDLNTKGRYAVMAMADLARHGGEAAVPLTDIAERQQISLAYLEQIFQKLRRAGVVESARGRLGGYRLARGIEAITVGEVMAAVEEPVDMTRCHRHGTQGCVAGDRCLTHNLWDALSDHIAGFLGRVTLKDVLEGQLAVRPLTASPFEAAAE
jgi:Rrf2 family protein